jgi:hypothetical protein
MEMKCAHEAICVFSVSSVHCVEPQVGERGASESRRGDESIDYETVFFLRGNISFVPLEVHLLPFPYA